MPDGPVPAEDPAAVRLALADVVRDYGPAALDDARLVGRLLPDLLSGAPRATALVSAAANALVGRLLRERAGVGMPTAVAITDVGAVLSASSLLQAPACAWIVGEYAVALGIVTAAELDAIRAVPPVDPNPYQAQPAHPYGAFPQSAPPAPPYLSPGQVSPAGGYPGYQAPYPGYAAAPPPAYAPPPGYPAAAYVAAPVGYAAPARTPSAPVPGGGYRIAASMPFYVLAAGSLIGFQVDHPSVPSPTVWVLCAVIFALTGAYVATRATATMLAVLIAVGAGALRYLVLPTIADAGGTSGLDNLFYRSARAPHWLTLAISAVTAVAVVLLAVGESGPAAASGSARRPTVVTAAGWLLFALTFYELFVDFQFDDFDPYVSLLPALAVAVWRGGRGGQVLGLVVVGLSLLRDGQILYDMSKYSYGGSDRQYIIIEMVLLAAVGVVLVVAGNQPYFRSAAPAPRAYPYPPAAQVWHNVPTQVGTGGIHDQPPAPTTVE